MAENINAVVEQTENVVNAWYETECPHCGRSDEDGLMDDTTRRLCYIVLVLASFAVVGLSWELVRVLA